MRKRLNPKMFVGNCPKKLLTLYKSCWNVLLKTLVSSLKTLIIFKSLLPRMNFIGLDHTLVSGQLCIHTDIHILKVKWYLHVYQWSLWYSYQIHCLAFAGRRAPRGCTVACSDWPLTGSTWSQPASGRSILYTCRSCDGGDGWSVSHVIWWWWVE